MSNETRVVPVEATEAQLNDMGTAKAVFRGETVDSLRDLVPFSNLEKLLEVLRAAYRAAISAAPPTAAAQGDDLAMPAEHVRIGDAIWRAHCDLPDDLCITVDIENFAISVTLNRNMCAIGDIWDSRDHAGGLAKAILTAISHAQAKGVSGE